MLWLFYIVASLVTVVLMLLEPGVIEEIVLEEEIEGFQIGPELLLLFAIIFLVPLVMAFLSLTLKGSANRWANIILGIVFAGLDFIGLIERLVIKDPSAYAILMNVSTVMAPALIVWYAWKSKQKA